MMRFFILLALPVALCFAQADVSTATSKGTVTDGSYLVSLLLPGDYEVRGTNKASKSSLRHNSPRSAKR